MTKLTPCGTCCKIIGHEANAGTCPRCCVNFQISCIGLSLVHFVLLRVIKHDFVQILCKKYEATVWSQTAEKPREPAERAKRSLGRNSVG
ncbi:unnamed protein product [Dicrocoelium dendriticum]|nr:unnamed protein product [Dicrocoelium dendriticum]